MQTIKQSRFIALKAPKLLLSTLLPCLLSLLAACAAGALPIPAITGQWTGSARIIVTWCQQTNLNVSIRIHPDATVSGRIGDAALINGRFKQNRHWLGRALNLKTDYIIVGRLEGFIVASEQICRPGVYIPLNFDGTIFHGAVHSTGTHIGGRKHMVLTAAGLKLHRDSDDHHNESRPCSASPLELRACIAGWLSAETWFTSWAEDLIYTAL